MALKYAAYIEDMDSSLIYIPQCKRAFLSFFFFQRTVFSMKKEKIATGTVSALKTIIYILPEDDSQFRLTKALHEYIVVKLAI